MSYHSYSNVFSLSFKCKKSCGLLYYIWRMVMKNFFILKTKNQNASIVFDQCDWARFCRMKKRLLWVIKWQWLTRLTYYKPSFQRGRVGFCLSWTGLKKVIFFSSEGDSLNWLIIVRGSRSIQLSSTSRCIHILVNLNLEKISKPYVIGNDGSQNSHCAMIVKVLYKKHKNIESH